MSLWILDLWKIPQISKNLKGLLQPNTSHIVSYDSFYTAWEVPKCRVLSGPYFSVFGLITEIYGVALAQKNENVFPGFLKWIWKNPKEISDLFVFTKEIRKITFSMQCIIVFLLEKLSLEVKLQENLSILSSIA